MIIQRYLFREVVWTFLAVTALLMLIFLSGTFVRILAETLEGDYPVKVIFSLFGLKGLANLVLVLPLSFFLGVMLALGRLYKDSEMTALIACGVGPGRVLTTVGGIGAIVSIAVGALSLYLAPWAEEQGHRLLDEAKASSRLEGLAPGRFNPIGDDGGSLVYLKELNPDNQRISELFVHGNDQGSQHLLTAKSARQIVDQENGQRYLVLEDGYRYEGEPGEADFRIIHFKEHGLLLQEREVVASKRRRNAVPSTALWNSDDLGDIAELQWRLSVPVSLVLLGLLGVLLSKTSPRQGRYAKLFIGILLFIIYNNLLTMARSSLGSGEVSPMIGMWWVHALLLVLIVVLITRQGKLPGSRGKARRATV